MDSKIKFNILNLENVKDRTSRYGRIYSHEDCDVCKKQGVNFEVIKYTGLFDLRQIRQAIPVRKTYVIIPYGFRRFYALDNFYLLFYTCSSECNMLLMLKEMGGTELGT